MKKVILIFTIILFLGVAVLVKADQPADPPPVSETQLSISEQALRTVFPEIDIVSCTFAREGVAAETSDTLSQCFLHYYRDFLLDRKIGDMFLELRFIKPGQDNTNTHTHTHTFRLLWEPQLRFLRPLATRYDNDFVLRPVRPFSLKTFSPVLVSSDEDVLLQKVVLKARTVTWFKRRKNYPYSIKVFVGIYSDRSADPVGSWDLGLKFRLGWFVINYWYDMRGRHLQ